MPGVDGVVDIAGVVGAERLVEAEHFDEDLLQPKARRGAEEQVPVVGEELPDVARVDVGTGAIAAGNAKGVEIDAARVKHPEDVVVGNDQQFGRVGEGGIVGEPGRIAVAVRGDDRHPVEALVELAGDAPLYRIVGKQPVGIEGGRVGHGYQSQSVPSVSRFTGRYAGLYGKVAALSSSMSTPWPGASLTTR